MKQILVVSEPCYGAPDLDEEAVSVMKVENGKKEALFGGLMSDAGFRIKLELTVAECEYQGLEIRCNTYCYQVFGINYGNTCRLDPSLDLKWWLRILMLLGTIAFQAGLCYLLYFICELFSH